LKLPFPALASFAVLMSSAGSIGCQIVHVYKDHGISGAKGRDRRPEFDRLLRDATQRKCGELRRESSEICERNLYALRETSYCGIHPA
jgi:DNA invertase Pin-like site-specific DNA recombinase